LRLAGKEKTLSLTKVGNSCETQCSEEYVVPLYDKAGEVWNVRGCGIEEVTADLNFLDVNGMVSLFPGIKKEDIRRPMGNVDLLIGTDYCVLLPEKIQEVDGLKLMQIQFGYCVRGKHELLSESSPCLSLSHTEHGWAHGSNTVYSVIHGLIGTSIELQPCLGMSWYDLDSNAAQVCTNKARVYSVKQALSRFEHDLHAIFYTIVVRF
jgi:hypothetical protein